MAAPDWRSLVPAAVFGDSDEVANAIASGENPEVRGAMERMKGQLRAQGVDNKRADQIVQDCAIRFDRKR